MKLKLLAAALALALTGAANAALVGPTNSVTGSSLFLEAWTVDPTTGGGQSYTRDLGITLGNIVQTVGTASGVNATWTAPSFTFSNPGDTLFTDTFAPGSTVFWTITAGRNGVQFVDTLSTPVNQVYSTLAYNAIGSRLDGFVGAVNPTFLTGANSGAMTAGDSTPPAYGGNPATWNDRLGGSLAAGSVQYGIGFGTGYTDPDAVGFYYITRNATTAFTDSVNGSLGKFWLGSDGSANFSFATAVIPEPSSYLLLGAGLLAMGAIARRRTKSDV